MSKSNISKLREGVLPAVAEVSSANLSQYKQYIINYFRDSILSLDNGPSSLGIARWVESGAEEINVDDPVVYIPVKGVSPLTPRVGVRAVGGMIPLHPDLPISLKQDATGEIRRLGLDTVMAARSFNVLLHLLSRGTIHPFASDKKSNSIRHNFESQLARMGGFNQPIASPVYGVISHSRSGDIDHEDIISKIGHYVRAITLVLDENFLDVSTATLNDSTAGGMLNNEIRDILSQLDIIEEEMSGRERIKSLERIGGKYPNFTFNKLLTKQGVHTVLNPNENRIQRSILTGQDAIELEKLLRFLRKSEAIDISGSRKIRHKNESVELQIFDHPKLNQIHLHFASTHRDSWVKIRQAIQKSFIYQGASEYKRGLIHKLLENAQPLE